MTFTNPFTFIPSQPTLQRRDHLTHSKNVHALEHLHTVRDLSEYLATPRDDISSEELRDRQSACRGIYSCDPQTYEPYLLDDVLQSRMQRQHEAELNQLRGLIRAGSWMTYKRQTLETALDQLTQFEKNLSQDGHARIIAADPSTATEHYLNLQQELTEIQQIRDALRANITGKELEPIVRLVEDFNIHLWQRLKQYHAIRGEHVSRVQPDKVSKPLYQEIALLRPIRDLLYFRRVYPNWARRTSESSHPSPRHKSTTAA